MDIPKKEGINYETIKKLDGTGLEVKYTHQVSSEETGEVFTIETKVKSTEPIHQDLQDHFVRLKAILLRNHGYDNLAKKHYEKLLDSIEVTGVLLSGSEESEGCLINGKRTTRTGNVIALNSERIRFDAEDYGFEQDLQETCAKIETEAYKFIFEHKVGVLVLFP